MKDANAATDDTTQGRMTRKNSGFERDSNPRPTELSKPHDSCRVWVRPFMSITMHGMHIPQPSITSTGHKGPNPEHYTGNAKVVGSNPVQSLNFSRSFFQ